MSSSFSSSPLPFTRYQTSARNDVHQLLVTLSRNYYVTAGGNLKLQKKPFDFDFVTVCKSSKRLLVSYLLRDHFSGVYYAEATTHDQLLNLGGFLFRAWSRKEGYAFCGVPLALLVPQIVTQKWPRLLDLLHDYGIVALQPSSGFQAGMIDIKNWQRDLSCSAFRYTDDAKFDWDYNFEAIRETTRCVRNSGKQDA